MQNNYVESVMIVDDNEGDRYLLAYDLSTINYNGKIFEAENGLEALKILTDTYKKTHSDQILPPAVIFLDINMPLMNGYEFLDELELLAQENIQFQSIVVMILTSSELPSDKIKSTQHEFIKDYMVKDKFDLDRLRKIISLHNN